MISDSRYSVVFGMLEEFRELFRPKPGCEAWSTCLAILEGWERQS